MGYMQQPTTRGYQVGDVVSSLQKAIRRGDLAQATWWAAELDRSGMHSMLWNRLDVILSEDIGPAWPEGPAVIRALRDTWVEQAQRRSPHRYERLSLMHAVMLLARAPKCRWVDHALWANYGTNEPVHDIPDYALDMHTARGRQMGRGVKHFEAEAAVLHNEADMGDDPWKATYLAMFADKPEEAKAEAAYSMQWGPQSKGRPEAKQEGMFE